MDWGFQLEAPIHSKKHKVSSSKPRSIRKYTRFPARSPDPFEKTRGFQLEAPIHSKKLEVSSSKPRSNQKNTRFAARSPEQIDPLAPLALAPLAPGPWPP